MRKSFLLYFYKILKSVILSSPHIKKMFSDPDETNEVLIPKNEIMNSYSQYGEDFVIDGIIGNKAKGFFVDIGANDPVNFSNSKRFYDRGWSGINIEPNPFIFNKLDENRPRDINLNIGIGLYNQQIPFYLLSNSFYSSFNKKDAERNCKLYNEKIIDIQYIQILPLVEIFKTYAIDKYIDFISIDVEGIELEVLKSNDWFKYRPYLILIEINNNKIKIINYLKENDYELIFINSINGIFVDIRSKR